MSKKCRIFIIVTILCSLTSIDTVYGQNRNNTNSISKSIKSTILGEDRTVLIHLPANYKDSNSLYPDGNKKLLRKTATTIHRLSRRNINSPDMIVVTIENTNRNRDMWPTHTKYFPESQALGSTDFLDFFEKELIPHIESHYRTNTNRIICGQSLSAVFTLYAFLTKPYLFNSYITCSGAFPDCEPFFKELSQKAFQKPEQFEGKNIIITHGLKDPLDPDGNIHQQMTEFSKSVTTNLENQVSCKYLLYENEGHVPKGSLKDGLTFLVESEN